MPKDHDVHKYKRLSVGRKGHEIYKCMLPNCAHYLPYLELAVGRLSLCWGNCGSTVELTQDLVGNRKIVRPMCEKCKKLREEQRLALASIPTLEGDEYEE